MDLKKMNCLIVEKCNFRDIETKLHLKYWGCLRTVSLF